MISTLDLHHCTKVEAKKILEHTLENLSPEISELVIIHGYQGGQVIKDFVLSYRHHKILKVIKSINAGQTSYLIKSKK